MLINWLRDGGQRYLAMLEEGEVSLEMAAVLS